VNSTKILILSIAINFFVSCGKTTEYKKHFWPGPIQVFESNDSFRVFVQFDQVFTPLEKSGLWDHPTGKRKGARLWMAVLPKDGRSSKLYPFDFPDEVLYNLTFHPNLGRIFEENGFWFLWKGGFYRGKATLLQFDEESLSFDSAGNIEGEFSRSLTEVKKDNEAFILLNRYNETARVPMVFSDMMVSTSRIGEMLSVVVEKNEGAYVLNIVLEGEETVLGNIQIEIEDESEVVPEDYIDDLSD